MHLPNSYFKIPIERASGLKKLNSVFDNQNTIFIIHIKK
jgi:hypothetical protein